MSSEDSFGHDQNGLLIVQKKIHRQLDIFSYKTSMEMLKFGPVPTDVSQVYVHLTAQTTYNLIFNSYVGTAGHLCLGDLK